jgi:hypothetical protein
VRLLNDGHREATMDSTEKFSADPQELAARLRFSQERLRDSLRSGSKNTKTARVWAACMALLAGWGKASDTVHASTIEKQAGLTKGKASAILRDLDANGVIVWDKPVGLREPGTLSLPPMSAVRADVSVPEKAAPSSVCPGCGNGEYFDSVARTCGWCGAGLPSASEVLRDLDGHPAQPDPSA